MRIRIIGGSDAGISAALRAREVNKDAEVSVFLADDFPNYSICGLPFFLSGETPDWRSLAHRTEFEGIEIRRGCLVKHIDVQQKTISYRGTNGTIESAAYDTLIIGTGAEPVRPEFEGSTLPGVYELHTMHDAFQVKNHLGMTGVRTAIIIGAGYIGVEMADALCHLGLEVTLVGRSRVVFPSIDPEFGVLIEDHLRQHGVDVVNGTEITRVEPAASGLLVTAKDGWKKSADIVLLVVGVKPASGLARDASIPLGNRGAIQVNSRMETGAPRGFTPQATALKPGIAFFSGIVICLSEQLHTRQGRVAGENAAGGDRTFAGSVGTQVVKVFDLAVARTGLLHAEAQVRGDSVGYDNRIEVPGSQGLLSRREKTCTFGVTGDSISGKLIGAQIVGHWKSEVSKRIDTFAAALFHGMTVDQLNDLDLSYTPPLSSPWDPVQMSAQAWLRDSDFRRNRYE